MSDFFAQQGMRIQGIVHVYPQEALAAVRRGALFVDLREDYLLAMKAFDVPGVVHLPRSRFEELYEQLPKDRPIVLADAVGLYSKACVSLLQERGYTEVASLNGGIQGWEEAGLPTRTDPDELWRGSCMCQLKPRKKQ